MTEYEVYSYEVFRRKIQDELRTVDRADMEDFDQNALAEYFIRLRKMKPNLSRQPDEKSFSFRDCGQGKANGCGNYAVW